MWADYTATVAVAPSQLGRGGIAFRYQNDRCYYFFGIQGAKKRLLMIRHATALHRPLKQVLAETPYERLKPGMTSQPFVSMALISRHL